jgi:hypothetical protein
MSKQEEANLILKLYELRREETMRVARDWYFREFHLQTFADFQAAMMGPHSGHVRMVASYWDMAAAFVNSGAISSELFNECNGEHFGVFMKIEALLPEIRAFIGPNFAMNLEKMIDATPDGRKRVAAMRERMKGILEALKAQSQAAKTA